MATRASAVGFCSDSRGAISIMAALALPMMVGFAGIAVDIGMVYNQRDALQGSSDLAALAAVSDMATAEATVRRVLTANGLGSASFTAIAGRYSADSSVSPSARFVAGATPTNAVAVSSSTTSPAYFSRLFHLDDYTVTARSIATRDAVAAFSITSELASVDNPIVSSLTSALVGSPLSIGVLDANNLAKVTLTGGDLSTALAGVAGVGAVTAPLDRTYTLPKFLTALANATTSASQFAAATVLRRLAGDTASSTVTVKPSQLLSIPASGGLGVGSPSAAFGLQADVLDLVNASVAPRGQPNSTTVGLTIPGLASVSVEMLLQEPPQNSGPIAAGRVGTIVRTAQLKARIKVTLGNSGGAPLKLFNITLPIEIVAAGGKAELVALSCPSDSSARTATLKVTPGVAKVEIAGWVGTLEQASLDPSPNKANIADVGYLLGVPLLRVVGRSDVSIVNQTPQDVTFNLDDVTKLRTKTVTTNSFSNSLATSLTNMQLDAQVLGLPLGLFSLLPSALDATRAVGTLITSTGVTGPLDQLISGVLQTAGVQVGKATVRVTRIDCTSPRLVG